MLKFALLRDNCNLPTPAILLSLLPSTFNFPSTPSHHHQLRMEVNCIHDQVIDFYTLSLREAIILPYNDKNGFSTCQEGREKGNTHGITGTLIVKAGFANSH